METWRPCTQVVELSRNHLNRLISPVLKRMLLPMERCAVMAGLDLEAMQDRASKIKGRRREGGAAEWHPFSQLLLVGGTTRMPAVRKFVENVTGRPACPKARAPCGWM